jgi:hypothetical protein
MVFALMFLNEASADPILLTTQRQIHGFARVADIFGVEDGGFSAFNDVQGPFSAFKQLQFRRNNISAGSAASQATNIAPDGTRWFGSGSATAEVVPGIQGEQFPQADATSELSVMFTVPERTAYHLNATLGAGGDTRGQRGSVSLQRVGAVGSVWDFFGGPTLVDVDRSGFLSPGTYGFHADAESGPAIGLLGTTFGTGSFVFDFQLGSPTPEPASLMLTGLALVGAAMSHKRRNRTP